MAKELVYETQISARWEMSRNIVIEHNIVILVVAVLLLCPAIAPNVLIAITS